MELATAGFTEEVTLPRWHWQKRALLRRWHSPDGIGKSGSYWRGDTPQMATIILHIGRRRERLYGNLIRLFGHTNSILYTLAKRYCYM